MMKRVQNFASKFSHVATKKRSPGVPGRNMAAGPVLSWTGSNLEIHQDEDDEDGLCKVNRCQ